jgi:hypothetical protein
MRHSGVRSGRSDADIDEGGHNGCIEEVPARGRTRQRRGPGTVVAAVMTGSQRQQRARETKFCEVIKAGLGFIVSSISSGST